MRKRANVFPLIAAIAAAWLQCPVVAFAIGDDEAEAVAAPDGEDRWVPSLAITSGAVFQRQAGIADSESLVDMTPPPVPLGGFVDDDDFVVAPFVGAGVELMAPALPIPTRPRFFVSGEILPTFGSDRNIAVDGDPGCIKGPERDAPCTRDETVPRAQVFDEASANGKGSETTATIDLLVFGASLGAAFPVELGTRRLRIKPSFGWLSYEVDAEGTVVDAECLPVVRVGPNLVGGCANTVSGPGFLREITLTGSASRRFHGIGPGLDIEVDAGRLGPVGASLFMGARAYKVLGNRTIAFGAAQTYDDLLGTADTSAQFEVEVDPWLYRAHVGIRFQWLGSQH